MRVSNKLERGQRIRQKVDQIIRSGKVCSAAIEPLRGSLNFCTCSEAVRQGLALLDEAAVIEHLRFWPRYFANVRPRTVNFEDARPPTLIFTDGAEEDGVVGVGGMLLDESVTGNEFFGGVVGDTIVEEWMKAGDKRRVIHQAEVFRAAVAVDLCTSRLRGSRATIFVDNSEAKACLIKGTSASKASAKLVTDFWCKAAEEELYIWIGRVASASNPSDAPSRRVCPTLRHLVRDHMKKSGDDVGGFFWTTPCELRRREAVTSTPLGTKQQQQVGCGACAVEIY